MDAIPCHTLSKEGNSKQVNKPPQKFMMNVIQNRLADTE